MEDVTSTATSLEQRRTALHLAEAKDRLIAHLFICLMKMSFDVELA